MAGRSTASLPSSGPVSPREGGGGLAVPLSAKKEIINIQVGKSGNDIGHEFWRDLCEEHEIRYDKNEWQGLYMPSDERYDDHLHVFFNEGQPSKMDPGLHRWVPRCILVDLNMTDLNMITHNNLGDLYKPENIIYNDEGSGNCYAKAFHTEGPDLADKVLETVRREVEKCNSLQGVQFIHGISGGTGSGLTGLLMKTLADYLDKNSKCIMQNFTLVPSPKSPDIVLEPYNAALAMYDLLEYSDQVFLFDNAALTHICQQALHQDTPKMRSLNNIVALCMSGITSCLRFTGPLNADLHKMHTNLVPFKHAHFLISSFAPLVSNVGGKYARDGNCIDLAQQMMSKEHTTVKVDPLSPGDQKKNIPPARFLASWTAWRGKFLSHQVDTILYQLQKKGSRWERFFPDWIPNSIASNICQQPHCDQGQCVVLASNSTAVHEVFDNVKRNWDNMFAHKAFVHTFEQDGISTDDMMESRNILEYISEEYLSWARKPDSFFDDSAGVVVKKESAIENDEHQRIVQELMELKDGEMYITETLDRRVR